MRRQPSADVEAALGALAVADPRPNATMRALADRFADPGWRPSQVTAFSSARKWSAASYDGQGTWLIGSPEMILGAAGNGTGRSAQAAVSSRRDGYRVLLLARAAGADAGRRQPAAGPQVQPVALVTLEEQLRPDAQATLDYFASQGVSVRVLSGDHPATVGAIARRLGLPGAGQVLDARELPATPGQLAAAVGDATVIGRVAPHQKRAIVGALQARGHVVAMTGDGVNDVLALKNSDVGIAMGSGTPASRGVARLVLLDDSFATLPGVVAEGRRIIGNVDRVSRLFLTKTSYAVLIALAVAAIAVPYPFYPTAPDYHLDAGHRSARVLPGAGAQRRAGVGRLPAPGAAVRRPGRPGHRGGLVRRVPVGPRHGHRPRRGPHQRDHRRGQPEPVRPRRALPVRSPAGGAPWCLRWRPCSPRCSPCRGCAASSRSWCCRAHLLALSLGIAAVGCGALLLAWPAGQAAVPQDQGDSASAQVPAPQRVQHPSRAPAPWP